MSLWRFILIPREGEPEEVENPVNWNGGQVIMPRDPEWHGVFFEYTFQSLEFHGRGAEMIKAEYDLNGANGVMGLRIEFFCSEGESWDEFYTGNLSFGAGYEDTCGDECKAIVGLEQSGDVMLIRNNYRQSVNLNSNVAFDGQTQLTQYDYLNRALTIPGRGIPIRSQGVNNEPYTTNLLGYPGWSDISGSGTGTVQGHMNTVYQVTNYAEIRDTQLPAVVTFVTGANTGLAPYINVQPDTVLKCTPDQLQLSFRVKGQLEDISNATRIVGLGLTVLIGPAPGETIVIVDEDVVPGYEATSPITSPFDYSFNGPVTMQPGDKLWMGLTITYAKTSTAVIQFLNIRYDEESFFNLEGLSICEDTEAPVYYINEAASRVVEAITNNRVRLYSEKFGRTNSQPYATPAETCEGAFAITNGLNLRRRVLADGSQPGCFITLEGIFNALRSIWNIGLAVEPDINRPGFNRLRFEDWRFFYQEEVGIIFNYPTIVRRRLDIARAYARLMIGYTKWEAEQYSGLNEFMTEREYRNGMIGVDTLLDRRCEWILASYTAEVTRRQDEGSDDYRYDNDIFGFCLRLISDSTEYEVEQMRTHASGIQNVSDPDTCYNGRVSPVRNAMRWFNWFMQGLRHLQAESQMIFTRGTGNYKAKFKMNECDVAGEPVAEDANITLPLFDNINSAKPPIFPEVLTFDHAMNYNTFIALKNNPTLKYKQVQVNCNGTVISGWIRSITYTPERGLANVVVEPLNDTQLPDIVPPDEQCTASVVPESITVSGWSYNFQNLEIDFQEANPGATQWFYIITKGTTPGAGDGFSGTTTQHPFIVEGITPGTWSIFIVPYCSETEPGQNYVQGTFTFEAPPLMIRLRTTYSQVPGNPLKKYTLIAEPVGGLKFPANFSFMFGECNSQGFCNGYPGAFNPGNGSTLIGVKDASSASAPGVGNMAASAHLTSITIYNRTDITPAQIEIAPGETWTLNFL